MKRELFAADHELFRSSVRAFVDREVSPHLERWEEERLIDRDVWHAAGRQGIIGLPADDAFGGGGQRDDYRYRCVVIEELARVHATSLISGFSLQDDIVIPYLSQLADREQQQRWLPALVSGERIGAIAMTEPGTGSDLQAITTSAQRVDGGWRVNGAKTFITNGILSDLVITVCRTDPAGGSRGFSLLVIERDMPGFSRGRKLAKVGLHAQDTAELFFDDVFVPDINVLGDVGGGFAALMRNLPLERLSIAFHATAAAHAVFADTVMYTKEREIFGQPLSDFQNTRFELASMSAELDVTRAYVDRAVLAFNSGDLSDVDAAKAKLWASEMENRIVDRCVQLHGGYGFMTEYPVARAYQDARVQRIHGGANEVMKQIIGRSVVGRR